MEEIKLEGLSITVRKTPTGYILDTPEPNDELGTGWVRGGREDEELDYTVEMLYDILTYFGMYGSKHDQKRIRIVIEEQDKGWGFIENLCSIKR